MYAVNGEDGNWYRGRVESFDDSTATVFYVDYGNSENVSFNTLRALDSEFNVPCMICVQVCVLYMITTLFMMTLLGNSFVRIRFISP